jgi:hypothetical protein
MRSVKDLQRVLRMRQHTGQMVIGGPLAEGFDAE